LAHNADAVGLSNTRAELCFAAAAVAAAAAGLQDVDGAANMADMAEAFGLGKLDSRPVIVQPASAHTGKGLSDGLKWLVEAVKRSPRRHLVTRRKK
jgi:hypothetical protein